MRRASSDRWGQEVMIWRQRRPIKWLTGVLVCVLMLAQMLGLMHGVVHGLQAQGPGHGYSHGHKDDPVKGEESAR